MDNIAKVLNKYSANIENILIIGGPINFGL